MNFDEVNAFSIAVCFMLASLFWQNVRPLPEEYEKAIKTLFNRYTEYLAAFEPKEIYLKKKVETELGSKMIYLKMRCGGLDADWAKV